MIALEDVPEQAIRAAREADQLAAAHLIAGHRFIDEPGTGAVVAEVGDGFRVIHRSGYVSDVLWSREVAEAIAVDAGSRA